MTLPVVALATRAVRSAIKQVVFFLFAAAVWVVDKFKRP